MSLPPEVLEVVRQWIEKAEHDLANAEHTLTMGKDCPYVEEITPYAIETRYPGEWEPQTREDAEQAVAIAHRIKHTIRKLLPEL